MQLIMEPQNLRASFGQLRATLACLRAIFTTYRASSCRMRAAVHQLCNS